MSALFILGAILALSVLIIVHESGHYFVAKWCKMRVDRFSLGFGPGVLSWERKGTRFQLAPIPFGGFVEIRGMNIAEEVDPRDEFAYPNRPVWQRFLTIFAGPATNYLFAIVLALVLYLSAGVPTGTAWYVVGDTINGYDAHGKLVPGDKFVAVQRKGETEPTPVYAEYNGKEQPSLSSFVNAMGGRPMRVVVEREGELLEFTITPKLRKDENPEEASYLLGIDPLIIKRQWADAGLVSSVGHALYYPVKQTQRIGELLVKIAQREEKGELAGPVRIGGAIKQAIETGWVQTLQLLMILNVMLGLFNLFPLPALDGGRLVFLIYEMATRRRANPKIEQSVHMVGIMFLLVLMVVVTYRDCQAVF